ncbi:hypothetical protein, partial [Acinetobacter baumannii]|uniref:hypothetical protein n=1 Tax=Acinetobacter baumannii TaxID=470 RepID=UPI00313C31B0
LRSNSIELRFRSVRRGNFLVNTYVTFKKSKKQLGIRYAHKTFLLAMLGREANFCMKLTLS